MPSEHELRVAHGTVLAVHDGTPLEPEGLAQPINGGGDITVAQRRDDCGCDLGGAHRKFRFALQRAGVPHPGCFVSIGGLNDEYFLSICFTMQGERERT